MVYDGWCIDSTGAVGYTKREREECGVGFAVTRQVKKSVPGAGMKLRRRCRQPFGGAHPVKFLLSKRSVRAIDVFYGRNSFFNKSSKSL